MTKKPLGKVKILNKAEASIDLRVTMKDVIEAVVTDEEDRLREIISNTREMVDGACKEFSAELKNVVTEAEKYITRKYAKDLKPLRAQFSKITCIPTNKCMDIEVYLYSEGVFSEEFGWRNKRDAFALINGFEFSGKDESNNMEKSFKFIFPVFEEDYNNMKSTQKAIAKCKVHHEAKKVHKNACSEFNNLTIKSKQFKSQLVKNLLGNTEEGRTLLQSMKSTKNLVRKALMPPKKK